MEEEEQEQDLQEERDLEEKDMCLCVWEALQLCCWPKPKNRKEFSVCVLQVLGCSKENRYVSVHMWHSQRLILGFLAITGTFRVRFGFFFVSLCFCPFNQENSNFLCFFALFSSKEYFILRGKERKKERLHRLGLRGLREHKAPLGPRS